MEAKTQLLSDSMAKRGGLLVVYRADQGMLGHQRRCNQAAKNARVTFSVGVGALWLCTLPGVVGEEGWSSHAPGREGDQATR